MGNPGEKINHTKYFYENKYRLYAGDRMVYECTDPKWGVNGGIDTIHDSFE